MGSEMIEHVAARLDRLESENLRLCKRIRRMHWLGGTLLLMIASLGIMGATSPDNDNVEGRLIISDPADNDCRIELIADDGGTAIKMYDKAGVLRGAMNSGTAGQFVKFFDAQGQPLN